MISIIIVGYNSKEYLKECIDSILDSSYKRFRIIFVDNDSSDGSLQFIEKNYHKVVAIRNNNTGYAGGNNVGIKKALELGSDYLFLLNPDTIVDKECLSNLAQNADEQTIIQPLILLNIGGKNTNQVNTSGGHINFLGFSYCSDYKKDKSAAKDKEIATASGAAVMIPSQIIKKIGLFDESFFMYHEDVDLFWRARLFGYHIRLLPDSIVWHKYSFSRNKNKLFFAERNRLVFLHKNFSLTYRLLIFPAFAINELLMILYSLFSGWILIKLRSYVGFFNLIFNAKNRMLYKRIPKSKITSLKKYISPELHFSEMRLPLESLLNFISRAYWNIIRRFV